MRRGSPSLPGRGRGRGAAGARRGALLDYGRAAPRKAAVLRRGAPLAQADVVLARAALVGMPFQADGERGVLQQAPGVGRKGLRVFGTNGGGVEIEIDDRAPQHRLGALASGRASADTLAALQCYAQAIGLAFQVHDDILDVTGDSATLGKAVGKDANAGKATFVSLLGLEQARKRAADLVEEACDSLADYGDAAKTLKEAAHFVVKRAH